MTEQEKKNRIIRKLVAQRVICNDSNTIKFCRGLPFVQLCTPLVVRAKNSGNYSYMQLANKYGLTYEQVRNIIRKHCA